MKTSLSSNSDITQSRVIEHQLRENPIYARSTVQQQAEPPPHHLDHCNSLHHHHHQQQQQATSTATATGAHSYERLDHIIINPPPTSSSANPAPYNLLTVATPTIAVTSADVVNTMGYLVATPTTSRDQLARPVIIWAPRSRDVNNELNVVTDVHQHGGRHCCCGTTSVSGLPSAATTSGGGGYMQCDAGRTRTGGEASRDRHHVTSEAESRHWLSSRDHHTNRRHTASGQYASMSHVYPSRWPHMSAL